MGYTLKGVHLAVRVIGQREGREGGRTASAEFLRIPSNPLHIIFIDAPSVNLAATIRSGMWNRFLSTWVISGKCVPTLNTPPDFLEPTACLSLHLPLPPSSSIPPSLPLRSSSLGLAPLLHSSATSQSPVHTISGSTKETMHLYTVLPTPT